MAKKILTGDVVKTSEKTIRVEIVSLIKHPIYGKMVKRKKNILAHDEKNEAKIGDVVEIEEVRPISRKKSFTLKKRLDK